MGHGMGHHGTPVAIGLCGGLPYPGGPALMNCACAGILCTRHAECEPGILIPVKGEYGRERAPASWRKSRGRFAPPRGLPAQCR